MEIPIYNKKDIIAHTKIDKEDFIKVSKFRWNLCQGYVVSTTKIRLHRLLLNAKKEDPPIDHINNDKLDNRKENLRFVSISQNSQNKEKQIEGTSPYKGVSFCNKQNKWITNLQIDGNQIRYTFDREDHAAYCYDQLALTYYGHQAKINGIDFPDDFEEPVEKKTRDLPVGIYLTNAKTYRAIYAGKPIGTYKIIEEAIDAYNNKKSEKLKEENIEIKRNNEGIAIITTSKNQEILVDDDKYNELVKYSWYLDNNNYATTTINKKKYKMHRYLMKPASDEIVDHINNNTCDNRIINLRNCNHNLNAHNKSKKKNATSKYIGVTYYKTTNRYLVSIKKDKTKYNLGYFKTEEAAAEAYNKKALELYGEYANLNDIKCV